MTEQATQLAWSILNSQDPPPITSS